MCRSIKLLRKPDEPATPEELNSAALQFVRKVTGFHKPSKANQKAFERAVREISDSSGRLLKSIATSSHGGRDRSGLLPGRGTKSVADQPLFR